MYQSYCLSEQHRIGGGRKREVKAKGTAIQPHNDDRDFIAAVKNQAPGVGYPNALMVYYHLLGDSQEILPVPTEPKSKNNKPFAWIIKRTAGKHGMLTATIEFQGAGQSKRKVTVSTNIDALRERLKSAGHSGHNNILSRSLKTWRKAIDPDKEAPKGARYGFKLKSFSPDYHATQVAESPGFKQRMESDHEFANWIAELAVKAAASATGITVHPTGGFGYTVLNKYKKKTVGLSESDLDDAIQQGIMYLSNQSASSPEMLDNIDLVRKALYTGAMNHVKTVITKKDHPYGGSGGNTSHWHRGQLAAKQAPKEHLPIDPEPSVKIDTEHPGFQDFMAKYNRPRPAPPRFEKPAPNSYHSAEPGTGAYVTSYDTSAKPDEVDAFRRTRRFMKAEDFRAFIDDTKTNRNT